MPSFLIPVHCALHVPLYIESWPCLNVYRVVWIHFQWRVLPYSENFSLGSKIVISHVKAVLAKWHRYKLFEMKRQITDTVHLILTSRPLTIRRRHGTGDADGHVRWECSGLCQINAINAGNILLYIIGYKLLHHVTIDPYYVITLHWSEIEIHV